MDTLQKAQPRQWFYSYNFIFTAPLTIHAKMIYLYLCRCADDESKSFPSRQTIAKACSMGLTSVREGMIELINACLLAKEASYRDNGSQTSNTYMIYPEPYG